VLQEEIRTRFEVERALRSSEEKFAIVFRSSPAAKVIISLETGKFLDVNAAFEAQSGYSREELLQQPVLDAGIWSNADLDVLRDVLRQEHPLAAREMRLRHRSGREATIVFSAEVVPVGGQKCLLLAGLDTTARKHAEERQRAMLKALPDWVFLTDASGVYLEFYGRERDLLMPPSEFIGRNMADVLPPELAAKSLANIKAALESDEPTHMEYSLQIGSEVRYYEVRSVRTERDHVLSLVRDVTDQKRAEYRTRELGDEVGARRKGDDTGRVERVTGARDQPAAGGDFDQCVRRAAADRRSRAGLRDNSRTAGRRPERQPTHRRCVAPASNAPQEGSARICPG
jgi:PAS domain S-box-containing protein